MPDDSARLHYEQAALTARATRRLERAKAGGGGCTDCEMEELLPLAGRRDVPFEGLQSLLINVENEGPDLANTCRSFASRCLGPLEIGIFADMTSDDSLAALDAVAALPNVADLWIIKHDGPEPMGCGRAKDRLVKRSRGDFLWHSDGHNRAIRGVLDMAARFGSATPCVIQPALGPLHQWPTQCQDEPVSGHCYYGGRLTIKNAMPDIDQQTRCPRRIAERTQCVNNSCFGYPRALLERFGGWHKFPGRWGHQEAGFSWRLWWTKTPLFVLRDLVIHHRYQGWWGGPECKAYLAAGGRKRAGYSTPGWHRRANRRYAIRVCFDDATWERYWQPTLAIVDRDDDGKADAALADSDVEEQHTEMQALKRQTDEAFFREIAGLPYNPAEEGAMDDATRGLYLITGGLGNALMCVPAMKALARLSGEPIDVWDCGLHVKALRDWLELQPWVRAILTEQPDYRQYKTIIGSYWKNPDIAVLDGCAISPAKREHRTKHEAWSNMEAVRNAGYTGPTPSAAMRLPATAADPRTGDKGDEYIVVCTEAAGRRDDVNKCYPHWEQVCRQLKAAGVNVVILGNNEEVPAWMSEVATCEVGKTEFMLAVEDIASARLYLGIDNGLAHVAAALHVPQVLLYGPTSPRKNLQLAQGLHVIETDFRCAPCFDTPRKNHCKTEPAGAMPCMRAIKPERVARKVLHLLDLPYADALSARQVFLSRKQMIQNCGVDFFQQWDEVTQLLDVIRRVDPARLLVIGTHHAAWELAVSGVCSPGTEFLMVD
ncbi:MAG TPA: glycosyltransferase family 9 protein, partial [Phycisphaerae bacterium]|nr:glycosyltransferase family 9 protein [Phycisphaerae bacterium]